MHRCLWISEIVANIANEIEQEGWDEKCSTLAKLARTCRMFSEPSLNSLWRVQKTLVPVLRTMPADLWRIDAGLMVSSMVASLTDIVYVQLTMLLRQRPNRPIKPTDWSRFQTYSTRIHHFICDESYDEFPSHEGLQALVCAKPPNIVSFFSSVQRLDWHRLVKPSDEAFQCMPFFMSAATQRITFTLDGLGETGMSLVRSILYNFPGVRHVDIQGFHDRNRSETEDALSELFSHGQDLCDVKIGGSLPQIILKHLAGFEHLKRLAIGVNDNSLSTQVSGFHALENLRVFSKTFRITSRLIPMLKSPLDTVYLAILCGVEEPQELANIFELMKLHLSHPHLRKLTIRTCHSSLEPPGTHIDHKALQHLFVFSNLSHVELLVEAPMCFNNTTVLEMVSAWPQLSCLILGLRGRIRKASITPAGLIPLFCLPRLIKISIAIDGLTIDASPQHTTSRTHISVLRSLDLQNSAISEAEPMAAFLSKFAPNLKDIRSWGHNGVYGSWATRELTEEYKRRWKEVARLVPLFAAAQEEGGTGRPS
ncbi:hypothetical protein HWV62_15098 [Athelia sp. TMB]|nr:hypothetical protein HWV62_15098 [Athelia sp. TMB]